MKRESESLIVESGAVSTEWLIHTLHHPWDGELFIKWDSNNRDVWPVTVNRYMKQTNGVS